MLYVLLLPLLLFSGSKGEKRLIDIDDILHVPEPVSVWRTRRSSLIGGADDV